MVTRSPAQSLPLRHITVNTSKDDTMNHHSNTHRLHSSSFLGITFQDPKYKPQKGPTMELMGIDSNNTMAIF